MEFTYKGYEILVNALKEKSYVFADYHDYERYSRCVILRHDIDNSIEKAVELAALERELGVKSTYFTLVTSDFYNPGSKKNIEGLRKIQSLGHEIGLHFDEMAYDGVDDVVGTIKKESKLLSDILGTTISTVSMHRPSQKTLEANYEIPGMINSYGKTFFNDFKYLSDSRRRWREPVLHIITSGQYDRLHILTHAIWYNDIEMDIHNTIKDFVTSANQERYYQEKENIKDIESILDISEI
jgi:hypothetical protein